MEDWKEFITKTKKLPPRKLLKDSLKYVKNFKNSLDIGAGGLRDTRLLLRNFDQVDILDSAEETKYLCEKLRRKNFKVYIKDFSNFKYQQDKYDLINAQFSLPFININKFNETIENIKSSLNKNGVLVGNFFGYKDAWNNGEHKDINFHHVEDAQQIFSKFKKILIREKEYNKKAITNGEVEKWHVIEFIIQKI